MFGESPEHPGKIGRFNDHRSLEIFRNASLEILLRYSPLPYTTAGRRSEVNRPEKKRRPNHPRFERRAQTLYLVSRFVVGRILAAAYRLVVAMEILRHLQMRL